MEQQQVTTLQKPIGSGFDASSTTGDVIKGIHLTGKTAIVTGCTRGIGQSMAIGLAEAGADIILIQVLLFVHIVFQNSRVLTAIARFIQYRDER